MRGVGRALTKAEVARAMRAELGAGLSEAYLSQLEAGRRQHLTAPTRSLLARFFKVHPGYLVGRPRGLRDDDPDPGPGAARGPAGMAARPRGRLAGRPGALPSIFTAGA